MTHSQLGQDQWVIDKLGANYEGFFVDLGAYDGVRHSNTLLLEQSYGWDGICIEANKQIFPALKANRRCTCVKRLISDERKHYRFVYGNQWSGICDYMPTAFQAEHERRNNPVEFISSYHLWQILAWNKCPSRFDYLSLDVEGAELPILEDTLWNSDFRPRLITVEFRYDQLLLEQLEQLLEGHGYRLDQIMDFDACFELE